MWISLDVNDDRMMGNDDVVAKVQAQRFMEAKKGCIYFETEFERSRGIIREKRAPWRRPRLVSDRFKAKMMAVSRQGE